MKALRIIQGTSASKDNPPKMKFSNASGVAFSTLHSMDYTFFEEVNAVVQKEPADAMDPETLGALASIGIQKGKPFAPDARMKKILTEAENVGTATARALTFRYPDKVQRYYPDSAWGILKRASWPTQTHRWIFTLDQRHQRAKK